MQKIEIGNIVYDRHTIKDENRNLRIHTTSQLEIELLDPETETKPELSLELGKTYKQQYQISENEFKKIIADYEIQLKFALNSLGVGVST